MGIERRQFIKLTGLTALGVAGAYPLLNILSKAHAQTYIDPAKMLLGKRWAMAIDLKKCRAGDGCRDCIEACHATHNVPQFDNPRHEIKWIWEEKYHHAFPSQQHEYVHTQLKNVPVPVLCNHCDNPPCVKVCPTKATFRRDDGIVMMDQHRCIGCRFCMAACPYGSRSFNWLDPRDRIEKIHQDYPTRTKGVVEKCNFCAERLADGLLPACVEACPYGALVFGDLDDPESKVRELMSDHFTIRRKPELGTNPQVYYIV